MKKGKGTDVSRVCVGKSTGRMAGSARRRAKGGANDTTGIDIPDTHEAMV